MGRGAGFEKAMLQGHTQVGEDFRAGPELVDRFIPMLAQDMYDLIREEGLKGIGMALPAAFGVGVQTYGKQIPQRTTTPMGRPKISFRQPPSVGETIVNKITGTQVTNIPTAQHADLQQARQVELLRQMDIDAAKRLTLEDGKRRRVGNTIIYLERGIVKSKTMGRVNAPLRQYERMNK